MNQRTNNGAGGILPTSFFIFSLLVLSGCQSNDVIYIKQTSNASNNSANVTESDPLWTANYTSYHNSNWDTAYNWGNHANAGYLITESDPQVGTLTNSKWCAANGTALNCDQEPPITPSPKFVTLASSGFVNQNEPAAETAFYASYYMVKTNLSTYTQFRFGVARAAQSAAATSIAYPKFLNGTCNTLVGSSWTNLSTSNPSLSMYVPNQAQASPWYDIVNTAKDDVCVMIFTQGGDGVLDPQYRNLWVEFK